MLNKFLVIFFLLTGLAYSQDLRELALKSGLAPVEYQNLDSAKSMLGRSLFFDPALSLKYDKSCANCHNPALYGSNGELNAASIYNIVYSPSFKDIEVWLLDHIHRHLVLDDSLVISRLSSIHQYQVSFTGKITMESVCLALKEYLRGLVTPGAFDAFLQGNNSALSDMQKDGLKRFIEVGCVKCHTGPRLGGPSKDTYLTSASLRNVSKTYPYGRFLDMPEVLEYEFQERLHRKITRYDLQAVPAFLETLTGKFTANITCIPQIR